MGNYYGGKNTDSHLVVGEFNDSINATQPKLTRTRLGLGAEAHKIILQDSYKLFNKPTGGIASLGVDIDESSQ